MTGPTPTSKIRIDAAPNASAAGCGILFALPFFGAGLFAFSVLLRTWGQQDAKHRLLLSVFALVFSAAGLGLLALIRQGRRRLVQDQALRQRFPTEPWRWRPEWQSSRIAAQLKSRLIGSRVPRSAHRGSASDDAFGWRVEYPGKCRVAGGVDAPASSESHANRGAVQFHDSGGRTGDRPDHLQH